VQPASQFPGFQIPPAAVPTSACDVFRTPLIEVTRRRYKPDCVFFLDFRRVGPPRPFGPRYRTLADLIVYKN
jgi:hypothetical protein